MNIDEEIEPTPYIPATLAVNQESRSETLKHYYPIFVPSNVGHVPRLIVPRTTSGWTTPADRTFSPGWVNPSLDSIFIRCPAATVEKDKYAKWLDHIAAGLPEQKMSKFQQMEIRHVFLYDEDDEDVEPGQQERMLLNLCKLVKRFTGLKTIVLTSDIGSYTLIDDDLEEVRKMTVEILTKYEHEFVAKKVPVVLARDYEDLHTGVKAFY